MPTHSALSKSDPVDAPRASARFMLGLALILVAFNLRPIFSSASALLPEIISVYALTPGLASLLTTLPVLCLGLFSPAAPWLSQRIGVERTLLGVLALLAVGTALRGAGAVPLLFLGTALAGACIAVGNVLLPGLVKRDFSNRMPLMTGLYTMALCAGAALGAGLTLRLEHALDGSTQAALSAWSVPVLVVLLLWLPQSFSARHRSHGGVARQPMPGLWRDRVAWSVTLFMGLQSALAYSVLGWLVPILRARGLSGETAGTVVSVSVAVQAVSCLVIPHIAARFRDQRLMNCACVAIAVSALLGLLFAPVGSVWAWAVLQGIGQGGTFAMAMLVIVLRSPSAPVATQLAAMAQGIGYLLAALGPLAIGLIRARSGGFEWSWLLFLLLGIGAISSGWRAGRIGFVHGAAA
ncbi:MAG: MFS transporter [Burkholderiaceae bacterium]